MARKPKTQPSIATIAALPAEKVAAIIETLAPAGSGRKALGHMPKPSVSAAVSAALQAGAGEQRVAKPRKAKPEATPDSVKGGVPGSEALPHADETASGGLAPPDAAPELASDDAHQPLPKPDAPAPLKPAVHWDHKTGAVQFDWPAIEQIALHAGANQGMAKLLVAARAEGANSRWPL
jgi:hypothetical protein